MFSNHSLSKLIYPHNSPAASLLYELFAFQNCNREKLRAWEQVKPNDFPMSTKKQKTKLGMYLSCHTFGGVTFMRLISANISKQSTRYAGICVSSRDIRPLKQTDKPQCNICLFTQNLILKSPIVSRFESKYPFAAFLLQDSPLPTHAVLF